MSTWLGGMLGGAAPRPTTHAQPKAGPHTAHPQAAPRAAPIDAEIAKVKAKIRPSDSTLGPEQTAKLNGSA